MLIETNIESRDYTYNEVVRICNIKQQIFYLSNNVYPIDIYTSYDDKNDRKIIVMIYEKEKTKELYQKWLKHEVN